MSFTGLRREAPCYVFSVVGCVVREHASLCWSLCVARMENPVLVLRVAKEGELGQGQVCGP